VNKSLNLNGNYCRDFIIRKISGRMMTYTKPDNPVKELEQKIGDFESFRKYFDHYMKVYTSEQLVKK
jgi:hypothetical protein